MGIPLETLEFLQALSFFFPSVLDIVGHFLEKKKEVLLFSFASEDAKGLEFLKCWEENMKYINSSLLHKEGYIKYLDL